MKLFVPEPKITLYEDGFDKHDLLSRKPTADRLSDLVERIDDPLVVALDGTWGSGKSFFLKCWVGQHLKRPNNTTTTVYFGAFAHDYLSDPLIALTGAIGERLSRKSHSNTAWRKAKTAAFRLAPLTTRIGLAALTAGATELVGPVVDAVINAASSDVNAAAESFWKREDGKRAAMEQFRNALTELTAPDADRKPTRKLVVVIDELDRCRPDYALQLLEVIKHFFTIPGIHFVLGVNLEQLENTVAVTYGNTISGPNYLQKFIHVAVQLPLKGAGSSSHNDIYFEKIANLVCLDNNQYMDPLKHLIRRKQAVSLREVERLVSRAIVTRSAVGCSVLDWYLVAMIIFLQVTKPTALQKLFADRAQRTDLLDWFGQHRPSRNEYVDPNFDAIIDWLTATDFDPTIHLNQNVFSAADSTLVPSDSMTRLYDAFLRGIDLPPA